MVRITEDLVRKCAEHNECEIFSLEELSLHQRNISKLEHLDKWCRDLKILYLHNNLISKIENLSRLKKLEYVNFTLNNIVKIENLEGCESLKKLDFTANFIGDLISIENLKNNYNLEELYLTGNPCVDYEGYKDFVLATLPQLKRLDGENIKVSERIMAMQMYNQVRRDVFEQQKRYMKKIGKSFADVNFVEDDEFCAEESCTSDSQDRFWKQPTSHTPQSRIEIYKHMEKTRYKDKKEMEKPKRPKILFTDDGRPLNVNEPKLDFEFIEDEENNSYKLDIAVYRHMNTSLLEVDVQPNYVRVLVKGKVFQIHLPAEVQPDSSTSLRSQTTGHLLITMPKVQDILKSSTGKVKEDLKTENKKCGKKEKCQTSDMPSSLMESLSKIATKPTNHPVKQSTTSLSKNTMKNISHLIDNSEVPPLI